jgi:hypothetical protein
MRPNSAQLENHALCLVQESSHLREYVEFRKLKKTELQIVGCCWWPLQYHGIHPEDLVRSAWEVLAPAQSGHCLGLCHHL